MSFLRRIGLIMLVSAGLTSSALAAVNARVIPTVNTIERGQDLIVEVELSSDSGTPLLCDLLAGVTYDPNVFEFARPTTPAIFHDYIDDLDGNGLSDWDSSIVLATYQRGETRFVKGIFLMPDQPTRGLLLINPGNIYQVTLKVKDSAAFGNTSIGIKYDYAVFARNGTTKTRVTGTRTSAIVEIVRSPGQPFITVNNLNQNYTCTQGFEPLPNFAYTTISNSGDTALDSWTIDPSTITYTGGQSGWIDFDRTSGSNIAPAGSDSFFLLVNAAAIPTGNYTATIPVTFSQGVATQNINVSLTITPPPPLAIDNVYNEGQGIGEHWVYITPAGDWDPGDPVDTELNLIISNPGGGYGEAGAGNAKRSPPTGKGIKILANGLADFTDLPNDPTNPDDPEAPDSIYWWTDNEIKIGIPAALNGQTILPGTATVRVYSAASSVDKEFTIKPRIYGPTGGSSNTLIRLSGSGFGPDTAITFDGQSAVTTYISSTTVEVQIPDLIANTTPEMIATVNGIASNIVDFTIEGPPSIDVNYPNGGEIIPLGQSRVISWNHTGSGVDGVKIELSTDGGATYPHLIVANTPNDYDGFAYLFQNIPASTQCKIRISDPADGEPADESNGFFTITAPIPTITEIYNKGLNELDRNVKEPWVYVTPYDPTYTGPTDATLNLAVKGYNFGEAVVNGDYSAPAGSAVYVQHAGSEAYLPILLYYWQNASIDLGLPADFIAGPAVLRVNTPGGSSEIPFTIKPRVYGANSALPGSTVAINGSGFGPGASATFGGQTATISSIESARLFAIVPAGLTNGSIVDLVVSINGIASNTFRFTVATSDETDPDPDEPLTISAIEPNLAEVGQTIKISGAGFGSPVGEISFGSTAAAPTVWSNQEIRVAVPSENIHAGNVVVTIRTGTQEASRTITITGDKIYLDDFEGGSVGGFAGNGLADSGYYVFQNVADIAPANDRINADLKQGEAAQSGEAGARVKYSYIGTDGSSWGGGWGAKLAQPLDLRYVQYFALQVKWDGSGNQFKFGLQDQDGTAVVTLVNNETLMGLNGYSQVTLFKSDFLPDPDGSAKDANDVRRDDGVFDWEKVANYNLVYSGQNASAGYHFIDEIIADLPGGGGDGREEITVNYLDPAVAPAGTKITIVGRGFGVDNGHSFVLFENTVNHASYKARVVAWNNTAVEVLAPPLGEAGDYLVRVVKVSIAADLDQAWQSAPLPFKISARASVSGGNATTYPNPFNPQNGGRITIAFDAGLARDISLTLYDMTGRTVYRRLVAIGQADTRVQNLSWDGTQASWNGYNQYAELVGDGVYLLRVSDEESKQLLAKGKILVIKH